MILKCLECGKECNGSMGLTVHVSKSHVSEEYYNKYLRKNENEGICLGINHLGIKCEKETTFSSLKYGYHKFCSPKCFNNDTEVKEKKRLKSRKNCGEDHFMKTKDGFEKYKQAMIKKFGVPYPLQSKEVLEVYQQNFLTNHGTKHPSQLQEIKDTKRLKSQKKYGTDNISQSLEIKEKKRLRYQKNYKTDHWAQTDEGRECGRITMAKAIESKRKDGKKFSSVHGKNEDLVFNIIQPQISDILEIDQTLFGYWPDRLLRRLKAIIEWDENDHKNQIENDKKRDKRFMDEGFTVIRIKESEWLEDSELQIIKIQETITFLEQVQLLK